MEPKMFNPKLITDLLPLDLNVEATLIDHIISFIYFVCAIIYNAI